MSKVVEQVMKLGKIENNKSNQHSTNTSIKRRKKHEEEIQAIAHLYRKL